MHPTPRLIDGKWHLDLRKPWGFGRYVIEAHPRDLEGAIHASYALLSRLKSEHAGADAQLVLPEVAGRSLGAVIEGYLSERKYRKEGGKRWVLETCALLRRELGSRPLSDFVPPAGTRLLWAYRKDKRKGDAEHRPIGPNAMYSRLNLLEQILRWASEPPRMWIAYLPVFPDCKDPDNPDEKIRNPVVRWFDTSTFRAVRANIYEHQTAKNGLCKEFRRRGMQGTAAEVRDLIERRRLYLSVAWYTGMRKHDLDLADDTYFSVEMGIYWRHGRKTGVEIAPEKMPKPLRRDLEAELRRLGRPWRKGEAICGGPWKNAPRVMAAAADRAGVSRINLMDCRRSFVYHKAMLGTEEGDLVTQMGHADSRMIHAIYVTLKPRNIRDQVGEAWPDELTVLPGTGTARVIRLQAGEATEE